MPVISYFKGTPEYHIIRFRNGRIVGQGRGISFWYVPLGTTIVMVPVTSLDNPFIFNETTADFQDLSIQGTVSYRIVDPVKAADGFDFSTQINKGDLAGDGRQKIAERLVLAIQSHARAMVSGMSLAQALAEVTKLGTNLAELLRHDPIVAAAGLAIDEVHITSVQPTPEIRQALQTEYRETLQKQADQAIYGRRSYAVEKEREIKQSELATEIELAERRKLLVDTEARNRLTLAEASAKAEELELAVYAGIPATVLTGIALKAWAEKGGSIGNLSITPDMLMSALNQLSAPNPDRQQRQTSAPEPKR